MNKWPGKFIIGLTGNIATGKSVVRKMLEHLGAYGIDADALAHRAIAPGSPGFQKVLDVFGKWILDEEGCIDRNKLGRLVFSNPEALAQLEAIVHPLVTQAIDILVQRASQRVIVIEAIKLLEGELKTVCDSIWVSNTSTQTQVKRLMEKRKMSEAEARQRITTQADQAEKLAVAQVIIHNDGSFEDTWLQVSSAWRMFFPESEAQSSQVQLVVKGQMLVQRAQPRQAGEIAQFITRISQEQRKLSRDEVMAAFGEKAFLLLMSGDKLLGLLGWQVENLVARTDDVYVDPQVPQAVAAKLLLTEVEKASRDLQCEVSLLFLPPRLAQRKAGWQALGYELKTIEQLDVRAWQEATRESMPPDTVMLFKQLRQDRVLRPL
jgi:dephospho-CoA kinase